MKHEVQAPREAFLEYALAGSRVQLATSRHELLVQNLRQKYEAEIRESLSVVNAATAHLDAAVRKLRASAELLEGDVIVSVSDDGILTVTSEEAAPSDP